jgi:hypothetical protein
MTAATGPVDHLGAEPKVRRDTQGEPAAGLRVDHRVHLGRPRRLSQFPAPSSFCMENH